MGTWQLTGMIVSVGVLAMMAMAGGFVVRHARERKRLMEKRAAAAEKAAAERAAAEKAAAEKARAESAKSARAAAERLAAQRAALEQAALGRATRDKAAVEQSIAEWAAAEQAEAERTHLHKTAAERREAEDMDFRLRAVEEAITEWVDAERDGRRLAAATTPGKPLPKKIYTRTEAIHQQVRSTAEAVAKEAQELEFIKNRIETGVDFLPIEFKQTVDDWKEGRVLRHSSFDDIKLKFRFKAYSIEDGYELLYMYDHWIAQQRLKLRVFIRLLGTEVESSESIQAAIERAERNEREKYLEMDVDVIFTLHAIRDIFDKLIGMETVLKELEVVCRKRSEQIIAPVWEAKGSL
jgi:chemotaxis protein histidine kinase CheA